MVRVEGGPNPFPAQIRALELIRNGLHLHTERNELPVFRDSPATVTNYSLT